MQHLLQKGKWTRPTDKSAVYTEIEPGQQWGIRVTLIADSILVEAIDGEKCSWYQAPRHLAATVRPPSLFERIRGITMEKKLLAEIEAKRAVARAENAKRGQSYLKPR